MKSVFAPAALSCRRFIMLLASFALLAGCAGGPPLKSFPAAIDEHAPREIEDVPFHPQEALQCGPAALATLLGWSGAPVEPATLEPLLFLPERKGTLQPEVKAQARRFGRIPYEIPPEPEALVEELAAGHPVLVLQNNGLSWIPAWHYAVVVGVDPGSETLRLRSGRHEDYDLSFDTFIRTWARGEYWGILALPPGEMPVSLSPPAVLSAIVGFARVADPEAERTALMAAVSRWPENVGLRFALANFLYLVEERDAAETEYRRVLAIDPRALMALNNLAWLLAEEGRTDEALALLPDAPDRTAAELPQDPWAGSLADTARFVHCRAEGGSVTGCEAAPGGVD